MQWGTCACTCWPTYSPRKEIHTTRIRRSGRSRTKAAYAIFSYGNAKISSGTSFRIAFGAVCKDTIAYMTIERMKLCLSASCHSLRSFDVVLLCAWRKTLVHFHQPFIETIQSHDWTLKICPPSVRTRTSTLRQTIFRWSNHSHLAVAIQKCWTLSENEPVNETVIHSAAEMVNLNVRKTKCKITAVPFPCQRDHQRIAWLHWKR